MQGSKLISLSMLTRRRGYKTTVVEAQEVRDDVERHAKYIVMSELDAMDALTEEK